jgi:hypothetical protein
MSKYQLKFFRGIDDLKSLFAFHGNSQGDETRTNDIEVFKSSEGWLSFTFDCELSEEAIQKEVEVRKKANEEYVQVLKEQGKYEEEYIVEVTIQENPVFDKPSAVSESPLTSYRMVFIDDSIDEPVKELYWGYKHTSGTYQAKRYFGALDTNEAKDSPFCEQVVGPFLAKDREEALQLVKEKTT